MKTTVNIKLHDASVVDIDVDYNAWDDDTGSGMELEGSKIVDWNDANGQPIEWTPEKEQAILDEIENDKELDAEFWRQVGVASYDPCDYLYDLPEIICVIHYPNEMGLQDDRRLR